jgi:hypothetical protein
MRFDCFIYLFIYLFFGSSLSPHHDIEDRKKKGNPKVIGKAAPKSCMGRSITAKCKYEIKRKRLEGKTANWESMHATDRKREI